MGQLTQTTAEVQADLDHVEAKGWAEYVDGTYVSFATGLALTTRTKLECDGLGAASNTTYEPAVGPLWDTTNDKLLAYASGDAYDVRIEFKAQNTQPTSLFDVEFDIGGAVGVISERTSVMPKGANTTVNFSIGVPLYSLGTFVSNGCTLYLTPDTGTLTVWDIKIFVKRDFLA
jgi:hypothetical protein